MEQIIPNLEHTIDSSIELPQIDMVGGLFPRGNISTIIAAPSTGKTWLMQRIVSNLSTGGKILDGFAESEPKKSVIFAGEAGYEILIRRATQTCWAVEENHFICPRRTF